MNSWHTWDSYIESRILLYPSSLEHGNLIISEVQIKFYLLEHPLSGQSPVRHTHKNVVTKINYYHRYINIYYRTIQWIKISVTLSPHYWLIHVIVKGQWEKSLDVWYLSRYWRADCFICQFAPIETAYILKDCSDDGCFEVTLLPPCCIWNLP